MNKYVSLSLFTIFLYLFWGTASAHADPISAVTTFATWLGKAGLAQLAVKTAISIGVSALQMALAKKPKASGGIQTESTTTGDTNPQSFVMGTYTTAGNLAAPLYTSEYKGDDDNEYLTMIVDISDLPITSLNKVYIDDVEYTLGPQLTPSDSGYTDDFWYGRQLIADSSAEEENTIGGNGWVRFWDGTQTTADPKLVTTFGNHEERPWSENFIGTGTAYAVLTFKYRAKWFPSGVPQPRFEVNGINLFDPRKCPALGGVGSHVWDDPTTWSHSTNPIIMAYNLLKGIQLPDGSVYGIGAEVHELPLSKWVAAMNVSDEVVGGKPRYSNCGYEVIVDDEPLAVIEELLAAAGAKVAEFGGIWTIACGAPSAPVAHITDGQVHAETERTFDVFPEIDGAINKVTATFPDRTRGWAETEVAPYTETEWLVEDGGRETAADLKLGAVWEADQVARITREFAKDNRRFRQHTITLSPEFLTVDILDNITWTSEENGYVSKVFEVTGKQVHSDDLWVTFNLRERDPSDYDFDDVDDTSRRPVYPSVTPVYPVVNGVAGFDAIPITIGDGVIARRAGIGIRFSNTLNAQGVAWQIETVNDQKVQYSGTVTDVSLGGVDVETLPMTQYRVKVRALRGSRETLWSNYIEVTTPDVRFSFDDLQDEIVEDFEGMLEGLEEVSEQVEANRTAIADEVERAQQEANQIRDVVSGVQQDLEDEAAQARADAQLIRTDLATVQGDLATQTAAIRGDLATAQQSLSSDITDLGATLRQEYAAAITTGIQTYDVTVQGQMNAIAGRIDELTAQLTSEDLISNGRFINADLSYWTVEGVAEVYTKAAYPNNALVQSAPTNAVVRLAQNGSIEQTTDAFAVTANDRFRIRFSAATDVTNSTGRNIQLKVTWLDTSGAAIGSAHVATYAVPQNKWGVISAEIDPPDNAVNAVVNIRHSGASASFYQYVTVIEANTVDQSIEAEITSIKAAQATTDNALALFKNDVSTRFSNANAAIASEAATRSDADGALSQRIDTVSANLGTIDAKVTQNATAIANANTSIGALETKIVATYGRVQLIRDSDFSYNFAYWPKGNMTDVIVRDTQSSNYLLRDAPGKRILRVNSTEGQNFRETESFAISSGQKYSFGFYYGCWNAATAQSVNVELIFYNAEGARVTAANAIVALAPSNTTKYTYYSLADVVAPALAVSAAIRVTRTTLGSTGNVYVTGFFAEEQTPLTSSMSAKFDTLQLAQANADSAFTTFKQSAESRLDANAAAISTEQNTRTTADTALGGRIDSLTTRVGNSETAITTEQTARTTADSALGGRIDTLTTRVGTAETAISTEQTARTSADNALGGRIDTLTTRVGTAETAITSEQTARTSGDSALGTRIDTLTTRVGTAETSIKSETTARTSADTALGGRIDTLTTRVGNNETDITNTQTAITDANLAIGSIEEMIETRFGDTQLNRDPDFSQNLTWYGGALEVAVISSNKNDTSGNAWLYRDMPSRKAIRVSNGATGARTGNYFDASPNDVFDYSFYSGKNTDGPTVRAYLQWVNASGSQIGTSAAVVPTTATAGVWTLYSLGDVVPPAGTVQGRVVINVTNNSTGSNASTHGGYLTDIQVRRRAASDVISGAGIAEAKLAASDAQSALAQYKIDVNTRFGTNETRITNEITNRTNADTALGTRIDNMGTRVGNAETRIGTTETGLASNTQAIANVEQTLSAQFGNIQLVRDSDFGEDLKHWNGTGTIVPKLASASWVVQRDMPGRKALRMINNATNVTGLWFDVSPNATYDFSAYILTAATAPNVRVMFQIVNDAGTGLINHNIDTTDTGGLWQQVSKSGIVPPAGAARGRVAIVRLTNGDVDTGTHVTGIEVRRQGAFEQFSSAEISSVKQTAANATSSIAALDTTVTAQFGRNSAEGRFRVQSVANTAGSTSRIALTVATNGTANPANAGLFLEARSDGQGQVAIDAARFLLTNGNGTTARTSPFFVQSGTVYIDNAMIRNADITYLKIAGNTLYIPRFYSRADITLGDATNQSTPTILFNQSVPDFNGGGYMIAFNATVDSNINYDSFGRFQLLIDNVVVQTASSGIRVAGANGGGYIPISMIASYSGSGSTNIKVRGWSHAAGDITGNNGNADCIVRNMTLTISGTRR